MPDRMTDSLRRLDALREVEAALKQGLRIIGAWKKRINGYRLHEKMKANGTVPGRHKTRNDASIAKRRKAGLSIRAIAKLEGVSTTTVQKSLKEAKP